MVENNNRNETVNVEFAFGNSNSVNFQKAVKIAKKFDSYIYFENNGDPQTYQISEKLSIDDKSGWNLVSKLLELAGRWRSSELKLNGYNISQRKFSENFSAVQRCYLRKRVMGYDENYCLCGDGRSFRIEPTKKFGCAFEKGVLRELPQHGRFPKREEDFFPDSSSHSEFNDPLWMIFGRHNPKRNSFEFDKKKIRDRIIENSTKEACVACPAFSLERIKKSINELPDSIPLDDENYKPVCSKFKKETVIGVISKIDYLGFHEGRRETVFDDEGDDDESISDHSSLNESRKLQENVRHIPEVKFSDIGGLSGVLEEIRKVIVLPLTHPEYFKKLGIKGHKGILFYGPPGNGKTLIAKAIAFESKSHFELISGPEVKSKWYGQSEENLREVFKRARKYSPSIIFIDEIDSIAGERSGGNRSPDFSVVAQLLVLMDGMSDSAGVTVIAATNRIDTVDNAVLRPGRFDYHLEIPNPGEKERAEIWEKCLQKMTTAGQIDYIRLSRNSNGFSGAAIAAACEEAGLIIIENAINSGISADALFISEIALLDAIEKILKKRS